MKSQLETLRREATKHLEFIATADDLRAFEVAYLGRRGKLAEIVKGIAALPVGEKKGLGSLSQSIRADLEVVVEKKRASLGYTSPRDVFDVTLPGIQPTEGTLHIVSSAIAEIEDIFSRIGFYRVRHPEVDTDWYAFESLNMPADHPARDEWETFFIKSKNHRNIESHKIVLTPHTSNGQVREMERGKLPIRMINVGKCYRRQSDVSHVPMFHQFEGLYIDKQVTIAHLKGVIDYFVHQFFGLDRSYRLRPFHFQFTEPSMEIDISCDVCEARGCRLCKQGWLELGGAGMVHPNVLKAGNIDPAKYSGFAFGWGVERTYMMKEGLKVDDIRLLYKNDLRFLEQF